MRSMILGVLMLLLTSVGYAQNCPPPVTVQGNGQYTLLDVYRAAEPYLGGMSYERFLECVADANEGKTLLKFGTILRVPRGVGKVLDEYGYLATPAKPARQQPTETPPITESPQADQPAEERAALSKNLPSQNNEPEVEEESIVPPPTPQVVEEVSPDSTSRAASDPAILDDGEGSDGGEGGKRGAKALHFSSLLSLLRALTDLQVFLLCALAVVSVFGLLYWWRIPLAFRSRTKKHRLTPQNAGEATPSPGHHGDEARKASGVDKFKAIQERLRSQREKSEQETTTTPSFTIPPPEVPSNDLTYEKYAQEQPQRLSDGRELPTVIRRARPVTNPRPAQDQ